MTTILLDTDGLSDVIHRKHNCLLHLRNLGERQLELVRRGSMTELLDLLSVKQQMLTDLQRIEHALDPFRNQDPDRRRWRTQEGREACAEELARCERLLAEIVRLEKQSEQDMICRRDEAAARLTGVHSAGHAREVYLAEPRPLRGRLNLTSGE
ncbi:MAG: hypothetical protein ACLQNE_41020 [Thermoguttaceae bacterium]|jgi:transposase